MILAFMAIQLQEILVEKETRAMITFKLRYQSEKKKKSTHAPTCWSSGTITMGEMRYPLFSLWLFWNSHPSWSLYWNIYICGITYKVLTSFSSFHTQYPTYSNSTKEHFIIIQLTYQIAANCNWKQIKNKLWKQTFILLLICISLCCVHITKYSGCECFLFTTWSVF